MGDIHGRSRFVAVIAANVRQREVRRQIAANEMRKAVRAGSSWLGNRIPAPWTELGTALMIALIGCWIISFLLRAVAGIAPIYTFATLGLFYSAQATYHKYRLRKDPNYKVPRCRCPGRSHDDTETVLRHPASSIAGVPNSLLSGILYATVIGLCVSNHHRATVLLATAAVLMGGYLAYVMLFRVRALCMTCVNLSALNILILLAAVL